MEEDPNFASFSDVSSTAESDNTLTYRRPVIAIESKASSLAKQMDNSNITKLCREDFDKVFDKLISPSLKFKTDIEAAMTSSESMTMQDIYRKMALTANQRWDKEADEEARKDSDKTLALYLSAPNIKNKLNKLRDDTHLFHFWKQHLNNMPQEK